MNLGENVVARRLAADVQSVRVQVGRVDVTEVVDKRGSVKPLGVEGIDELHAESVARLHTDGGTRQLTIKCTRVLLDSRARVQVA